MITIDLDAELAAAVRALSDDQANMLVACGVNRLDIDLGMVGGVLARIEGDFYVLDPDGGRPAFVTPVRVDTASSPESRVPDSTVRMGSLIDLVAWHPARPNSWAQRIGTAEWLGAIDPQYLDPAPVLVRSSPLSWFKSGCSGLVPLSRQTPDIYRLLVGCRSGVVAEDDAHAAKLRRILERPWSAPPVFVKRERRHAA
jgi:hypothetical protein